MERVVEASVVRPYILNVTFAHGARRCIDVEPILQGEMFEPPRDPALFAAVTVDHVLGTVVRAIGQFTAPVEWEPESQIFAGIIPGVRGAHTQAATLDELRLNLSKVLQLCLDDDAVLESDKLTSRGRNQTEVSRTDRGTV